MADATTADICELQVEDVQTTDSQNIWHYFQSFERGYETYPRPCEEMDSEPSWQASDTHEVNTTSPWYVEGIRRIFDLLSLETPYDGYETRAPNPKAARHATQVLLALTRLDFEPSAIEPSSDEGICISFRKPGAYADIECFNTGEVIAAMEVRGQEPILWELESEDINSAIARINHFILG
jgi:hypothetical protein